MKLSITTVACLGGVFLAGICLSSSAMGQETPPNKTSTVEVPATDADVDLLNKAFRTHFAKGLSISYDSDVSGGAKRGYVTGNTTIHCRFIGSVLNKFRLEIDRSATGNTPIRDARITIVNDGKQLWRYNRTSRQYTVEKSSFASNQNAFVTSGSLIAFFGALLSSKYPDGDYFPKVGREKYNITSHTEYKNNVKYRFISVKNGVIVFSIGIEPKTAKIGTIHFSDASDNDTLSKVEKIHALKIVSRIDPSIFLFTPPTGATKVKVTDLQ